MNNWDDHLQTAQQNLTTIGAQFTELGAQLEALAHLRDAVSAQVTGLGRGQGVELNVAAVGASIEMPYVLLRVDDKTWKMVAWRGRSLPIIGQLDFQTDGFTVSTVTPSSRLFTNVPSWVDDITGWHAAPFAVAIDLKRGALRVTDGDADTFRELFRSHLGKSLDGQLFKIQGGASWLRFLKSLLDRGIAPINRQKVQSAHWDPNAPCKIELRPYQVGYVEQFLEDGSITIVLPSGAGKTWIALYIIAHLKGHQYVFCDSDFLVGQWRARLHEYAPHADVAVMTYQAASRKPNLLKGVFALSDEGHRLPAPTWSKLAFGDFEYQASMTATVGDEERRTMLFALGGPPRVTPWQDLVAEGVLNRPRVEVLQVPDLEFKIQWLKEALAKSRGKRVLVYCDSLQLGKQLSRDLGIPFIYGETKNKFDAVMNAQHCILSKAIETALDLTDLKLIVEVDVSRTGRSMISAGQRAGRAGHSRVMCDFVAMMTPQEYARFGDRLVGIEMMFGDVITYRDLTGKATQGRGATTRKPSASNDRSRHLGGKTTIALKTKPGDALSQALGVPGVRRAILDAEAKLGASRQGYAAKAFRLLIEHGQGTSDELRRKADKTPKAWEPYRAGLNALVNVGLATSANQIYQLNSKSKV